MKRSRTAGVDSRDREEGFTQTRKDAKDRILLRVFASSLCAFA